MVAKAYHGRDRALRPLVTLLMLVLAGGTGAVCGCTRTIRLYEGEKRPKEQIAILTTLLGARIMEIDGQRHPDFGKAQDQIRTRVEILPGTHTVIVGFKPSEIPVASHSSPGPVQVRFYWEYEGPTMEQSVRFCAEAGERYVVAARCRLANARGRYRYWDEYYAYTKPGDPVDELVSAEWKPVVLRFVWRSQGPLDPWRDNVPNTDHGEDDIDIRKALKYIDETIDNEELAKHARSRYIEWREKHEALKPFKWRWEYVPGQRATAGAFPVPCGLESKQPIP